MSNKKISQIERQLYLFYTEDGFIDLAIGFVLLFFGLSLLADLPWLVGIAGILPLFGWYIAKQTITQKRTGVFVPKQAMRNRFTNFYLALAFFGIIVLGIVIGSVYQRSFILTEYPLSMFGLVLAIAISSLAVLLQTRRFFIHAMLVFLAMTFGEILNANYQTVDTYLLATLIAALIIISMGMFICIRFLKTYSVISGENSQ